jgi:hypothetical protein
MSSINELTIFQFASDLGCRSSQQTDVMRNGISSPAVLLLMTIMVMYSAMTGSAKNSMRGCLQRCKKEISHQRLGCILVL